MKTEIKSEEKSFKGLISPENEVRLANLAKSVDIKNKRLSWAVKWFARPIIKLFDNLVLERLPPEAKKYIGPMINIIIEEL